MRSNCIQIHQETFLLLIVAEHIGERLNLIVESADELRTHPETKTWDGMGRFAKSLYDNDKMWESMPEYLNIVLPAGDRTTWKREDSRKELLNCYQHLGGKKLEIKPETDLFGNKIKL
jgi:hypothetical protein